MGINSKNSREIQTKRKSTSKLDSLAEKFFIKAEKLRNKYKYKESVENYLNSILIDRNNSVSYLGIAISYKNSLF